MVALKQDALGDQGFSRWGEGLPLVDVVGPEVIEPEVIDKQRDLGGGGGGGGEGEMMIR